jgi:hypothetical protein
VFECDPTGLQGLATLQSRVAFLSHGVSCHVPHALRPRYLSSTGRASLRRESEIVEGRVRERGLIAILSIARLSEDSLIMARDVLCVVAAARLYTSPSPASASESAREYPPCRRVPGLLHASLHQAVSLA